MPTFLLLPPSICNYLFSIIVACDNEFDIKKQIKIPFAHGLFNDIMFSFTFFAKLFNP